MKHAGIVLAAGASTRMGQPKALLPLPNGTPLAQYQASLLQRAGCHEVVIVLGSAFNTIRAQLHGFALAENRDWSCGRFSSVQEGLRAFCACDGYLILPVDTVGVAAATLKRVCTFADAEQPDAVRPVFDNKEGQVAWLSARLAREVLATKAGPDVRLDEMLEPRALRLPVDDEAILNNVNAMRDWERLKRTLA